MTIFPPVPFDVEIDRGTTYILHYVVTDPNTGLPANLTGYTAHLQARPYQGFPSVILDYSTLGGQIVLGGTSGTIDVTFPPSDSANATSDEGVYDLLLTAADGTVSKVLKGNILFNWTVTN
jgi:hypothetical protein